MPSFEPYFHELYGKPVSSQGLERSALLKSNVNGLHLIRACLTLSDAKGDLFDFSTHGDFRYEWDFNLRDFDIHPESTNFLASDGFNFDLLHIHGIDSGHFAQQLLSSGFVQSVSNIDCITFTGAYDFGY
ncbi:probable CCR4-associated factor 1 homolog 11 [Phoenix dactylifera]|uniref:Probable CCR4-associated factor 1 homolog 11 n=1 Tax=Phoenix dactylifera TaxID=42345 RepID=A0A8B7BJF4_PHODC|nr:probable CCR4-associated factor 1 homolog 11 [Phoenix dactylifera]